MQIHELKLKKRKERKTIGRGGKRGTYSGRGNKGQKARSGASIDPLFEGGRSSLIERLKKVRGFKSRNAKKTVVKLSQLEKSFSDAAEITVATLIESKLVSKKDSADGIKILGVGSVTKKFTIGKGILLSESAKNAIIKAGGKITE
jgi:large subunit ribosomal protein L15